jgi:hypothetical protein
MTRQAPYNSGAFGSEVLSSLMMVVAATETCQFIWMFMHTKLVTSLFFRLHS